MYRKRNKGWLKHLDFAVLDLMCMQICLALAYFGRLESLADYIVIPFIRMLCFYWQYLNLYIFFL